MATPIRVVVLGYVVRGPLGGLAWHHLQYVAGLARLGHDVWFVEDSDEYPACYDPSNDSIGTDPAYGIDFAKRAFDRLDLGDRWAYHDAHEERWLGPRASDIEEICRGAEVLLNLSGVNPIREWTQGIPARVLVDTDPVFVQIRHLTDPSARALADSHTAFATFGERFGADDCTIPDDGYAWRPTRQPVVLDLWDAVPGPRDGYFTTVMQWDSYPSREYGGRRYGMKSESLGPYVDLPSKTGELLELALGSRNAPREMLSENGWVLRDPREPTIDPWRYQRYLRESKGEFSVAKHGYVVSRSGWFSERSAAYLASGRPVVVQDTGFSELFETGRGVLPFDDFSGALAGISSVANDYERHCKAARRFAAEYFDAAKVLPRLLDIASESP